MDADIINQTAKNVKKCGKQGRNVKNVAKKISKRGIQVKYNVI